MVLSSVECNRLDEAREKNVPWKKWGPYLSERQWGTVREDYSDNGNAWDYFSHDQARSRAYRWGEDGLAGISDDKQRLCFALALWNGKDPILKERLFGLTNSEGNHGEDVKEYYFYLDSTPTHSYMKYLYKYPQAEFPFRDLVETNRRLSREEMEYELIDTGVFNEDKYFDVFVEYAKDSPEDILIRLTACNRGGEEATLHVLPTLWFRNTWSRTMDDGKPSLREVQPGAIQAAHRELGDYWLYCDGGPELLFTENESNNERLWGTQNSTRFVKDGFHEYLTGGKKEAVNAARTGTKAAAHYVLKIGGNSEQVLLLRLTTLTPDGLSRARPESNGSAFGAHFDEVFKARRRECDEFYDFITPEGMDSDSALVMRQALAGMLWGKQHYYYDLDKWLEEHNAHPILQGSPRPVRNRHWFHMINDDIISMPDKWEYPWYAAWDLAFHNVALVMVDPDFAKQQLDLMLRDFYLHPNGQIPAYEWNFGDVNPPVHAWATIFVYQLDKERRGTGDVEFLRRAFEKLLVNFTWWVNRKDPGGRNAFEGGFLGLDNIGVFDRSSPLPTGGYLEQADGTAWMALYSQNMLQIAIELAQHDPLYEEMAIKFFQHFLWIAAAMDRIGEHHDEMWDEADGFYYDLLRLPDGRATRLKVRSMVGLLPLCACTVITAQLVEKMPRFLERAQTFLDHHPELLAEIALPTKPGQGGRRLLAVLDEEKLRRVLARMLDEDEFLSPYGIRSLSRHHLGHPYRFQVDGQEYSVSYLPAESNTGMFGGNSNWRGPIWMPVNVLIVRALLHMYMYYGDSFKVDCPTGSGRLMTLYEVAREISMRLAAIFKLDAHGRRPVFGGAAKFQRDPHWRDHVLFYEYFHGDNGAGLGASHQTGWTGVVAKLMQLFAHATEEDFLRGGPTIGRAYTDASE